MASTGTDSAKDSAMPTARFIMPPPDVAQQTPSVRCTRARQSAMNAAPISDLASTERKCPRPSRWTASYRCSMLAPPTPKTYSRPQSRSVATRASANLMAQVPFKAIDGSKVSRTDSRQQAVPLCYIGLPVNDGGGGEVAGVGEAAQHQMTVFLQLPAVDGLREAQRQGGTEQVAVPLEGRDVPFPWHLQGLAPVAQEDAVGLVGDERADLAGGQVRAAARFADHLGHDAIGPAHDLCQLRLVEVHVRACRARLPPGAAVSAHHSHIARILAVI